MTARPPLDGITVVSLEQAVAAPLATRHLADLGARVIKVERPGAGDFARAYDTRVRGLSSHFVWTNRSKESLTLDLKHAEAAPILRRLVERADVLVQNLAPGAAARLGLGYDALHPRLPRLIVCDISGYGDDPRAPGPDRDRKAYDLLIQAESGFLSITGTPQEPAKAGCSIADIAAGMYATTGILAALIERGRSGLGTRIDVSMLEAMAEWLGFPLYYAYDGAPPPPRCGAAHATIYPYGPFRVAGGSVMFGVQNEREWVAFCERVLHRPALAADARFAGNAARVEHRAELAEIIDAVLADLGTDEALARLRAAQIASARVNDVAQLWAHPQLAARGRWTEVGSPAGPLTALRPPGIPCGIEPRMEAVPALGQHTDAVLRELGCDDAEIARLRRAEAV